MRARVDVAELQQFIDKNRQHFVAAGKQIPTIVLIMILAYTIASILNVFTMAIILSGYQMPTAGSNIGQQMQRVTLSDPPNYNELEEAILARNIFNSSGEVPDESKAGAAGGAFDENAACEKFSLQHKLLGLVYMNTPNSLVVLQDPSYTEGDVYRAGDAIIDQEGVIIFAIERYNVVINNNGRKECIEVPKTIQSTSELAGDLAGGGEGGEGGGGVEPVVAELSASEVETALGPGGANLVSLIQTVPLEGQGFKVLRIRAGNIFYKAGLRNQDILKSVNGKSMLDPLNGSAIMDAMQGDREIRVELERNEQPRTLIIRIK